MSVDLSPWRDEAVAAVVRALYARHPELTERFGERGARACREDIAHHLDYLEGALAVNDAALFSAYAVWLFSVLDSRGVPTRHLAESFELLEGFFTKHLPALDAARVAGMLAAAKIAMDAPPFPCMSERVPALPDAERYREAALGGDQRSALKLVSGAMQEGITLTEASVRLIQPAMYQIGRLWQENRVSVAQEHLATAVSQSILARAYMEADFAPVVGRKAMFAAVAGNQHSLGLRMLSDAFETQGWDAFYLGADVPTSALIRQVDATRPDLLALSLSLPGHLLVARESLERLRSELGSRCPAIWIGGLSTLSSDRVWRSLKADGWAADALHALERGVS